jgi:hypothetical protein
VVLAIILKYNRLSYDLLKEKRLAYIIHNKLFICHGFSSKQGIDYSQLRAREPDHVANPIFYSMPMSQFPFGLVIPYSKKRIENMWNNNELDKLPDPKNHFIWVGTKDAELDLIQGGDGGSEEDSVSLSLMSISYTDVPHNDKQKVSLKKKAKHKESEVVKYLDISFDEQFPPAQGPQNPRTKAKQAKRYNSQTKHRSYNNFNNLDKNG